MKRRNLMDDISDASRAEMIPCFKPVTRRYQKDEMIMTYDGEEPKTVAVLLSGAAQLELLNAGGSQYVLERYEPGDVFGQLFALPLDYFGYTVTAVTDCAVLYLDYRHIVTPCERLCAHHSQLISNLFIMTAQKSQELSLHISILSQTTIRSKLLAYLSYARTLSGQKDPRGVFQIPMSISALADYLNVDRAALMREMKAMREDGVIESRRRNFRLLTDQAE